MSARIYKVEELNRALPLVRSIARDLLRGFTELKRAFRELRLPATMADLTDPLILRQLPRDVRDLVDEFLSQVEELAELGLTLRDPDTGLLEALGELDGTLVFFSFRPGEREVLFFQDPADPSGLRRPIPAVAV